MNFLSFWSKSFWYLISLIRLQRVMKKALFLCFFKVSVDQLFDNLESGKRNYCFGKVSGKSIEFWIKNTICTNRASLVACIQTPFPQEKSGGGGGGGLYTGYSLSSFLL